MTPLIEAAATRVSQGGVLVVEHARRRVLDSRAGSLERTRELRSGDSVLSFFVRPASEPAGAAQPQGGGPATADRT
jgi:hypothetical protein